MTIDELVKLVQARLPEAEVLARDLTGEGNHFEAIVVTDVFQGRSRVDRHRLVMGAVEGQWEGRLHALTFKTYTKKEWETL